MASVYNLGTNSDVSKSENRILLLNLYCTEDKDKFISMLLRLFQETII